VVSIITVSLCAGSLFAGPKIEFDTKSFQCGDVAEGKVDTLHAVFHIKNSGDGVLILKEVRPGCGCTVVKWDSTVQPGKTAKIEASVNIKGYHSGAITKYVTVRSNALNDSMERLSIQATVESFIEVSLTYLTYKRSDSGKEKILTFASKKKDLTVKEVTFEPNKYSLPGTAEQVAEKLKKLKQSVKFSWVKTDSTRADGYRIFHLSLPSPKFDSTGNGEFIITTNHPDKQEVKISVNLAP
jgi:hypothetical protein